MSSLPAVRKADIEDMSAIEAIIRSVGLFSVDEADEFAASLPAHFGGDGEDHIWLITSDGLGAAYLSPEVGPGVWNMLFLGVRPEAQRRGLATLLVRDAESRLRARAARMLLIDTSTAAHLASARALYASLGYEQVALISDFWSPGEGKMTFRKVL